MYQSSEGRRDGKNENQFVARYSLGERNSALRGMALEIGKANSVRLDAGRSSDATVVQADGVIADALRSEMVRSGAFYQGGSEKLGEFIFIPGEGRKDALDAIASIMESPNMQALVERRREAMDSAEQKRLQVIEAENTSRWQEIQKREQADRALREQGIADAKGEINRII